MSHAPITLTGNRLTTPRAAAIAGILFALLFTSSIVLLRLSLPTNEAESKAWLENGITVTKLALGLMPFAGIAFLWFVGVVRDRLGAYEDQFFSTIFYGSGLLFLAMIFSASAVGGGIIAMYSAASANFPVSEVYQFGRLIMGQLFTIYALRMAGVFVVSLGTIWLRTGLMPRWLSIVTYFFALILILSTTLSLWMVLVFPGWVLLVSGYIIYLNMKRKTPDTSDGMTMALTEKA